MTNGHNIKARNKEADAQNERPEATTAEVPEAEVQATSSQSDTHTPFGVHFSPLGLEALTRAVLEQTPETDSFKLLVTANLDHLVSLKQNELFRAAYKSAFWVTIDGAPVALWVKMRGFKHIPRVPGADLFPKVMEGLDPARHRPFFVTANDACGKALLTWLASRGFNPANSGFVSPPFGFEREAVHTKFLKDQITSHAPTHIFFGVGAPKSEIWLHENAAHFNGACGLCVGAGLEFFTGHAQRAPEWMREYGLEWLWRVFSDPKRLFKRYFVNSWKVLPIFWQDRRGKPLL